MTAYPLESPKRAKDVSSTAILVLGTAALAALPWLGLPRFYVSMATEIMIFSMAVMSLNLLIGYTGLMSFGHAAFFASGAYTAGVIANNFTTEVWVLLICGVGFSCLLAVPVGLLSIRLPGFYFLMITFAFAQMIYAVIYRWKWLGASDGLTIRPASLFGSPLSTNTPYILTVICFVAVFLFIRALTIAPFGRVLVGIRENTRRMRALGYDVRSYKLAAFTISAGIAGLAGALNSQWSLFASPESAHWAQSAAFFVMVLIGGAGTSAGPILGAAIYLTIQLWLSSYTQYWSLLLGVLFILLITAARDGVYGLGSKLSRLIRGQA